MWKFLILFMIISGSVNAAEVCKTVNLSSYTQEQKNFIGAAATALKHAAGETGSVTRWSNNTGEVCFENPTINLNSVLSNSNVTTKINEIIADAQDTPAKADARLRDATKAKFDGQEPEPLALRCFAKVLLDEINILRSDPNTVKPPRTLAQAKTAIKNCVDNKDADE